MKFEWSEKSLCFHVLVEILLLHCSFSESGTCDDPGVSIDGKREGNCCSTGNELVFSCFEDYELVGPERLVCLSNGIWSSDRPLCRPLKDTYCDTPPAVPNGVVRGLKRGDYFLPNDIVLISCSPFVGYKYSGSTEFVMCKEDGKWEADFGECTEIKKTCHDPGVPKDGKREGNCCTSGDQLLFSCYHGYELVGLERLECFSNETWSSERPLCRKISCHRPAALLNGVIRNLLETERTQYPYRFLIKYTCNEGYRLLGGDEWRFCVEHGWTGITPYCEEIKKTCHDPGVSKDGKREGNCCTSGDQLHFSCYQGYELVGLERLECLSNETWSSERPLCRPLKDYCDLPPAIPHGIVIGRKHGDYFLPNDEAEIVCKPGYKYIGSTEIVVCEEGGIWEDQFGECTEINCTEPETLVNGVIPELLETGGKQFPYKFQITYVCNEGYRLIGGDSWRFCGENGWSGKTPHCEEIRCPDPGIPENGERLLNNFRIGAKVRYRCFSGYDLLGSVERYCMPNGQWSGELSRCNAPSNYCPNPGTPINGFKSSVHYNYEDTVNFRCHPGYMLVGSEVRECLRNRMWSGTEAKCIGPYDFDNSAEVSQILRETLAEKFADEEEMKRKYVPTSDGCDDPDKVCLVDMCWQNWDNNERRLILHLAFDVSGSVGEHNFRRSVDFARAIVRKVGVSWQGSRVGAVTFSSKAQTVFLPTEFSTLEEVIAHLDNMSYTGGGTSASSALSLIRENIGLEEGVHCFHKRYKRDVVVIITDGKTNMGGSPELEANALKKLGVDIYCIGITGDQRIETLYKMASTTKIGNEERPNVFILQNYGTMSSLVQEIFGTVDYSQCGLGMENTIIKNKEKILSGKHKADSWPWMAAIYFKDEINDGILMRSTIYPLYELKCGGSIVNESFILTAAHCLYEEKRGIVELQLRDKGEILVKVGLKSTRDESTVQEFEVKNIHIHEKYNPGNILERLFDYDIALIELNRQISFGPSVRAICLPPKELPEGSSLYRPNEYSWMTGWGHIGAVSPYSLLARYTLSKDLQELYIPIQSDDRCLRSLEDYNASRNYFTDRMFCAGDGKVGSDACKGDSGSPLMQPQMNADGYRYWTQVGIVSWGFGCGMENRYGFYTHVQRLVSWIEDKLNDSM